MSNVRDAMTRFSFKWLQVCVMFSLEQIMDKCFHLGTWRCLYLGHSLYDTHVYSIRLYLYSTMHVSKDYDMLRLC